MDAERLEHFRIAEKALWNHYGVTPAERFVELPALGTRVRVQEVGTGEPLLFVHGSPNAGSKWAPLVAKLTDFRCLVLDRPGCGLSDPIDYQDVDLRDFGPKLLGSTLDALGLQRATVVASSLGGALAYYFCAAAPERVVRLVQAGCPAFAPGFRVPFYNVVGSLVTMVTGHSGASHPAFRHMGHATAMDRGRFASEVLVWRDALLKWTDTARHEDRLMRNITRRMRSYRYDEDFLARIETPTLHLWGEADPFGGVEVAKRLASAQPNAALETYPDSGHLPWLDDPDALANRIRGFLGVTTPAQPPFSRSSSTSGTRDTPRHLPRPLP